MNIRKAAIQDLSRIAEILVFVKRMNYRRIFLSACCRCCRWRRNMRTLRF